MDMCFCYNTKVEFDPNIFRDFIRQKFMEWRGNGLDSLGDFARYIGTSQQNVSNWYNGRLKERPNPRLYGLLISKYGTEVYDALGLPRPPHGDLPLRTIDISQLPRELADRLTSALSEIQSATSSSGIDPESEEGARIASSILSKHGLTLTRITTQEDSSKTS